MHHGIRNAWFSAVALASVAACRADIVTEGAVIPAPFNVKGNKTVSDLVIGNMNMGTLQITAGSVLTVDPGSGRGFGSATFGMRGLGKGTITGKGSSLTTKGDIRLGDTVSTGQVQVENGGNIKSGANLAIGLGFGDGTLTASGMQDGMASSVSASGTLFIGIGGNGTVTISGGATMMVGKDVMSGSGQSQDFERIRVTGKGSKFSAGGNVQLNSGLTELEVSAGANFSAPNGTVLLGTGEGRVGRTGSDANAMVKGNGSILTAKTVDVGGDGSEIGGTGSLTIADGATVDASVTVNKGGTLIGKKGVKNADKNVKDNGGKVTVAPGDLNIGGSYAQLGGGNLEVDLQGVIAGQFGFLNIAGDADFAAGSILDFAFMGPSPSQQLTFLTATGGLNIAPSSTNCAMGVFTCEFSGTSIHYEVASTSQDLILVPLHTPVPEPSSLVLAGLGVALMVGARRTRKA